MPLTDSTMYRRVSSVRSEGSVIFLVSCAGPPSPPPATPFAHKPREKSKLTRQARRTCRFPICLITSATLKVAYVTAPFHRSLIYQYFILSSSRSLFAIAFAFSLLSYHKLVRASCLVHFKHPSLPCHEPIFHYSISLIFLRWAVFLCCLRLQYSFAAVFLSSLRFVALISNSNLCQRRILVMSKALASMLFLWGHIKLYALGITRRLSSCYQCFCREYFWCIAGVCLRQISHCWIESLLNAFLDITTEI